MTLEPAAAPLATGCTHIEAVSLLRSLMLERKEAGGLSRAPSVRSLRPDTRATYLRKSAHHSEYTF